MRITSRALVVLVSSVIFLSSSSSEAFVTPKTNHNAVKIVKMGQSKEMNVIGGANDARKNRMAALRAKDNDNDATETASICIIGGGVAGLTAAVEIKKQQRKENNNSFSTKKNDKNIVLLESSPSLGGRVQSDKTEDGYILDRGFAVFIEEYPTVKEVLDYKELKLRKFLPGAIVAYDDEKKGKSLAQVTDPLRQPELILKAVTAPVGTLLDKIKVLPLLFHVFTNSVEDLFEKEDEVSTLEILRGRYGFSENFLERFYFPFLEGIYLAPLEEQSSRMFHFVFKMFSEGAATLPTNGMQAVTDQLVSKLQPSRTDDPKDFSKEQVDIQCNTPVQSIEMMDSNDNKFLITTQDGRKNIIADSVIVATEGPVAETLLQPFMGNSKNAEVEKQKQRSVACLYYALEDGEEPPITDPILVLNGSPDRGKVASSPINNLCFPSVVSPAYAPQGCDLCSVTVLSPTLDKHFRRDDETVDVEKLEKAVRNQLSQTFGTTANLDKWRFIKHYEIKNAQPAQYGGPQPANVNGGRSTFRDQKLPMGLYVCGDHMATATLNGAMESGVRVGKELATKTI